jgi:hypothetical protein
VTNVVHYDFSKRDKNIQFSADIYSHDMKKFQFEISCQSIFDAYDSFIKEAQVYGVEFVRCIAVYRGKLESRRANPAPLKVWQQGWCMSGLQEF